LQASGRVLPRPQPFVQLDPLHLAGGLLGNSGTTSMSFGRSAIGRFSLANSPRRSATVTSAGSRATTKAAGASPITSSGTPITAASTMSGNASSASSKRSALIRVPPHLRKLFARPSTVT